VARDCVHPAHGHCAPRARADGCLNQQRTEIEPRPMGSESRRDGRCARHGA
jgi:hypothetical protein